jgi:hypothetical protein
VASKGILQRAETRIVLCLLAAAPFLLTCWVHGDGIGYTAMLRSAVVQHDLELGDEFEHLSASSLADAGGFPATLMRRAGSVTGIDPTYQSPAPDPVTGRVPAYYSVGPALAWFPGYLVVHAASRALAPATADGYGGAYYVAIALASLLWGIAGVVLAYRLARIVAPERESFWAALALVWAAPLVYYLFLAPDYSHALTAFTAGWFYLAWWNTRHADRAVVWFAWGGLAGVLFLARWNDVVLALPVFALEAVGLLRRWRPEGAAAFARLAGCVTAAAGGMLLFAAPQLYAWQVFHGRPWVRYPEHYVGVPLHGLLATLVSDRHGLFVWTPITVLAVTGLLLLLRRRRELAVVALSSLALLVLANCTARDWWGGAAFGMRRLVSATPLFVLGLAVFLDEAARGFGLAGSGASGAEAARAVGAEGGRPAAAAGWLAPVVVAVFAVWNLLLLGQYALGMISHTDAVPLSRMAANQPLVVERVLRLFAGTRP